MRAFVQLSLDWLDPKPPVPVVSPEPAQPVLPLSAVLMATHIQHPHANRGIHLGATSVAYCLKRGQRKTIGISVGPDGLDVRAPRWVGIGVIEAFLHEKTDWILNQLLDMQSRQRQMQASIIHWRDGVTLPFLGETLVLQLDASHGFQSVGAHLQEVTPDMPNGPRVLRVAVSQTASEKQIRDAVQAWLMQQAKHHFTARLNHFAPGLGVHWKKLSLSNASTRWGMASADGSIRLNWRLVHFKQDIIDYVVVHELSHLRVMDHSPLFWDTVRAVVPDYAERRAQLKDELLPPWG
ncbi:MAG: M48 family peptidase [Betaproteobacteria bacterium]|nr:M48 family peptidase [Betaproteobacteria bacterium]